MPLSTTSQDRVLSDPFFAHILLWNGQGIYPADAIVYTGITMSDEQNGKKKWWYSLGVMGLLCIFFLGMDLVQNQRITWSIWPVAAILFFGVGFSLLNKFGRD
jgi:hypothetical protein